MATVSVPTVTVTLSSSLAECEAVCACAGERGVIAAELLLPHRLVLMAQERGEQILDDAARAGFDLHGHGHAGA